MRRRFWREGPLAEINNSTELEAWLRKQPREVSVTFAARAVLRVLPILEYERDLSVEYVFFASCCRFSVLQASPGLPPNNPAQASEFRKAAADVAFFAAPPATYAIATAARDAARATDAAAAAAAAVARTAARAAAARAGAPFATSFTAFDAAAADDVPEAAAAALWPAVSIDATGVEEGAAASDIARSPLWPQPQGQPDRLRSSWQKMKAALHAQKHDWQVWTIWYEDRLDGRVRDDERELAYVRIEKALWDRGPAIVNDEIKRRIEELEPPPASSKSLPRAWPVAQVAPR